MWGVCEGSGGLKKSDTCNDARAVADSRGRHLIAHKGCLQEVRRTGRPRSREDQWTRAPPTLSIAQSRQDTC